MREPRVHHRQKGLTLVEVLIALSVFALIGLASVAVMSISANSQDQVETLTDDLRQLERGRALIRADLLQFVPRRARLELASRPLPAMVGGDRADTFDPQEDGETVLLAFVRNGWSNPGAAAPRASVQRVAYILKDGSLLRRTWPFVDRTDQTPHRDDVLFAGVTDVEISFRFRGQWRDEWISATGSAAPSAVRLQFNDPRFGPMEHLFWVRGGSDQTTS